MNLRILNLGAGVQSTTIALRISDGVYPKIDAAIFADTGEEPRAVYDHLNWLIKETQHAFPILIRSVWSLRATTGRLGDDLLRGENSTKQRFASIPAYTKSEEATEAEGITRRQCTSEYKLMVIERTVRRELLGLKPKERIPKDTTITSTIGLSFDEPRRVLRVRASMAGTKFTPSFPLFDACETRANCLAYLEHRVPHKVPRSACTFCPYHSNSEWRNLRDNDPEGWKRACEVDNGIRMEGRIVNRNLNQQLYVHRSCVPLEKADLSGPDEKPLQYGLGFERECVGMCGV